MAVDIFGIRPLTVDNNTQAFQAPLPDVEGTEGDVDQIGAS